MHSDVLNERINQLDKLFQSLDVAITSFHKATKISCKTGCGACCIKPDTVWTTIGEMLPVAWKLYRENLVDIYRDKLDNFSDQATCILFAATDKQNGMGQCSQYSHRPSICRLFGSSIRISKNDFTEILACAWQRTNHADDLKDAESALRDGSEIPFPVANDWTWRVKAHFPESYLLEEYPINRALREAFLIVSQTLAYAEVPRT